MCHSIIFPSISQAHPGSLDENGGHYNRKTGEYHYHDGTNTGSGSAASSSNKEYDNVIFEDEVSGIKFLVPKNWKQELLVNSSDEFQVAFYCESSSTTLFYHRAVLADSTSLSKEDIAESFEIEQTDITQYVYKTNSFYCFSYSDGEMSFYYTVTSTDGYLHMFLQYPDNNKMSKELESILRSFVIPDSSNLSSEIEENHDVSNADNSIKNFSNDTNSQSSKESFDFFKVVEYIFLGFMILVCVLYYGNPLFSRISYFIYDRFFEKHLPKYNLWMYEKTMDNIKYYRDELHYSQRIIDDFHRIGIPTNYEIGADGLPKEKGCNDWGQKLTVYKNKNGQKLHVQYNCCNATEKCHIYQAFTLSFDPYDSLCKKCSQHYKIPDLTWYQTYKSFPKAEKNYAVYQKTLTDLYQKLYTYNKKCNSPYMRFLLSFNKTNISKLQSLNSNMQQLLK